MSAFEQLANDMADCIGMARIRVPEFGWNKEGADDTLNALRGSFVVWLTATEEARAQDRLKNLSAAYPKDVIGVLPSVDDPKWPRFLTDRTYSPLISRAEAMWGVRIAFTHSDGRLSRITNKRNLSYAQNAPNHLPGAKIVADKINLVKLDMRVLIRTAAQIREVLM